MFIFTKEIADLLGKIRKKAGLSQKEVAERIGLSIKSFFRNNSYVFEDLRCFVDRQHLFLWNKNFAIKF